MKSPIIHTDGRTYRFYCDTRAGFLIYIANRKKDERHNKAILRDEYGNTIAEGTLKDFRKLIN